MQIVRVLSLNHDAASGPTHLACPAEEPFLTVELIGIGLDAEPRFLAAIIEEKQVPFGPLPCLRERQRLR